MMDEQEGKSESNTKSGSGLGMAKHRVLTGTHADGCGYGRVRGEQLQGVNTQGGTEPPLGRLFQLLPPATRGRTGRL